VDSLDRADTDTNSDALSTCITVRALLLAGTATATASILPLLTATATHTLSQRLYTCAYDTHSLTHSLTLRTHQVEPYRNTGTGILHGVDEAMALVDEHVTATQAMTFSAFKGPFEDRITDWDAALAVVSEVLDEWVAVQRAWLYLQPIFDSPDINKQVCAMFQLDIAFESVLCWS
jgi:Dynein heavy chain, N-terminal region 2